MRDRTPYLGGVVDLPQLKKPADRRAVWRQTLATLARGGEGPGPLEGLHADALLAAVRVALADKLVDDTEWLAEPAAGAALYEIAAVVPASPEQRELGRRVLTKLLQGSAETFTAIATRMALGTGKGLSAPHVRTRIALVTELPISLGVPDGPMCLAFVSRRQVARELVVQASAGSLPSRRTASRIFERASREAATRAQQGDDHAMRAFVADGVAGAFERLLADREPLVWRHAAAARGLLAPWIPAMRKAIQEGVDPKLTPTEWRRAATSITAMMSVDLAGAQKLVKQWMNDAGPLGKDPGGAGALVWGLARAAEGEPEAAKELLEDLAKRAPMAIAQAVCDLGADFGVAGPFEHAIGVVATAVREHKGRDESETGALRETLRDLERIPRARTSLSDAEPREDDPLDVQVSHALAAFATGGARVAYPMAEAAFESVHGLLDALDAVTDETASDALARRASLTVLRQLDMSLLERSTLADLLSLAPSPEVAKKHVASALAVRERIAAWVLERFREREDEDKRDAPVRDATLRLMRLRAMLHLVDSDVSDDDPARAAELRKRWSRIAAVLLHRMETGLPPVLRRANAATLSRTLDALVRAEAIDPADALLAISRRVRDPNELRVLAEASMDASLRHALARYADLATAVDAGDREARDSLLPRVPLTAEVTALESWTRDGLLDPSNRAETFRMVVVRLQQSVAAIAQATALSDLVAEGGRDVAEMFEASLGSLAQLCAGARARLAPEGGTVITSSELVLAVGVARVLSGAESTLGDAVIEGVRAIAREVPPAFEVVANRALDSLTKLPIRERGHRSGAPPIKESLPPWLPARRTLGGFYVLRPLASGGVGSVLVAVRIEDRQEPDAERFALKVPAYDASAARTVSESEFFEMFRAEASALLAIPSHPNLARFVTFDTGSKPKPILVMELVEGHNLDHEIESRALDTKRVIKALDDVLNGLDTMHGVDVGHLDVKPSNVVLRHGADAVLVDFGLAGRRIRPGCATGPYGAPEVWSPDVSASHASPRTADVYAFGCMAFEAMTGEVLFRADSELQQIAMHFAHDGFPDKLRKLGENPAFQPFVELVFATLRRDPAKRPTIAQVRGQLQKIAPSLSSLAWPFA